MSNLHTPTLATPPAPAGMLAKAGALGARWGGWRTLAVVAYVAELLLFTSARRVFGLYISPVAFYGAGVVLGLATLAALRDQPYAEADAPRIVRRLGWGAALAVAGALLVVLKQVPIVLSQPLDAHASDIIPLLEVYITRFRSGEFVYRYITILPYPVFPNYLPTQWLPYVLAQKLGVDFRWMSLGLLLVLGFGAYQLVLLRQPVRRWVYGLLALLPGVVVWLLLRHDYSIFAQVLEPTIICYYFLLAASVLTRSAWLQAGAIALCLLGRYSVICWVPFFVWVLWREVGPRYALTVAGLVALATLVVYVLPFLAHDWTIFPHALSEYRLAALGEWRHLDPTTGLPVHLSNGLGAAPWVYRLLATHSLEAKVAWMQRLHVVASASVMVVIASFYWRYGRRYDYRYLSLVALKIYLATFYFFIQVPYAYLTSLSVLLSVFVLMLVLGKGRADGSQPARLSAPAART